MGGKINIMLFPLYLRWPAEGTRVLFQNVEIYSRLILLDATILRNSTFFLIYFSLLCSFTIRIYYICHSLILSKIDIRKTIISKTCEAVDLLVFTALQSCVHKNPKSETEAKEYNPKDKKGYMPK